MKSEISLIVKSIKKGNIEILLKWIEANKQKLYKMSWAYLKNSSDVEDVFHNTIIKVMENIEKLKNEEAFETWFISIMLNECRKILREKNKIIPVEDAVLDVNFNQQGNEDSKIDLINGLKAIDEEYKELIILKYYSGYSQKEIADILSIPIGTVKTKIFRGLRILRNLLEKED